MEDLSGARALCEALGGTYDEAAVRYCRTLETTLERLQPERLGHFVGIVSAIENLVEEGDGDATVVRHLGEALLALATVHRIHGPALKKLTQTLGQLHGYVAARDRR